MSVCAKFQIPSISRSSWKVFGGVGWSGVGCSLGQFLGSALVKLNNMRNYSTDNWNIHRILGLWPHRDKPCLYSCWQDLARNPAMLYDLARLILEILIRIFFWQNPVLFFHGNMLSCPICCWGLKVWNMKICYNWLLKV